MSTALSLLFAATLGLAAAHAAGEHVAPATEYAKKTVAGWISNPTVIEAVKAQNGKHEAMSEAQIIAADKKWRAEVDAADKPMISAIMGNAVSKYLAEMKAKSSGTVTEIFIMDNKGLNVGQSDVTSDYWQGDEAKWKKTYLVGPDAIFVDKVEKDESTQKLQTQVSMSIKDPATGKVIGAITVGINVDAL